MPTDTFFRLPVEKRTRIINAAWEEFTAVSYPEVSINRIIRAADIPRGSFYQYFADKDDLFHHLAGGVKRYAVEGYSRILRQCDGNMFRAALAAFDEVNELRGTPSLLPVNRCMAFVQQNPGMDFRKLILADEDDTLLEPVLGAVDSRSLRRMDRDYMLLVFHLSILALSSAVLDSLLEPPHHDADRAWLSGAMQIIQTGCLAPTTVSGTTPLQT